MHKIKITLALFLFLSSYATAQNLEDIFVDVDTIFIPGALPGHLSPNNGNVTPIISSSPCNIPILHYSVATEYQNGKVIAVAHEGIFTNNNINEYDNLTFLVQAMNWLNSGNKNVTFKNGWITNANTSTFQNTLIADNFSFTSTNSDITSASLSNTDILILGNDWNGNQAYLASELSAIESFVANGGSVLIAGLGWSWPNNLNQYPMNQVANLFGFEFTTDAIYDDNNNVDGSPKLYNLYPENLNTTNPYCASSFFGTNIPRGEYLRVLKIAVSTNGEFTQQNGGVSNTSALIDTWLEEINDIYGREYCVRFELIPNNDVLIFSNPSTDPWATLPNGSGGCTNANLILNDQASVIDGIIGNGNYDLSHVIAGSPFGGGCAGGLKSGLSGGLDIPVTRHEIGHQFSQSHTINHPGNSNYETENGAWTIQGGNAQSHAHAVSYHELASFLLNNIPDLGTKIPTNNNIPTVDAGSDVTIPISTPFTLTGIANDIDANDELTYVWDNMSLGTPQTIPVNDDSQGAIFMRLLPSTESSRTFPNINDVIANNNSNSQEQLPSQARIMDIRLTVNDNHKITYSGNIINASGTNSDDIRITVADAGPFIVTSQNTNGISYIGGSSQTVTWAVNGTDQAPINTQNVRISLSIDGGFTYPFELLNSTPNTGTAIVTIPNIATTTARIKVEAIDNIYFDINTHDFEIDGETSTHEIGNSSVKIFPNPSKDMIYIEWI